MRRIFYDLDDGIPLYEKETLEEIIKSGEEVSIFIQTKTGENFQQKLEGIKSICSGTNATIKYVSLDTNQDYIYDEQEMREICVVDNICKQNNLKLYIKLNEASGEYNNLVVARNSIEEFVQKLNSTKLQENGKEVPLSPFEKYLICYRFVASRVYNESENFGDSNMRNWIGVLSTDKVICSGFASLLKCVCDRAFTKDELQCFIQGCEVFDKQNEYIGGHANNLVVIKDPKYNLDGMFYSDACWSSQKERNNYDSSFEYCLFPITKIARHKKYNFKFDNGLFFYNNIGGEVGVKDEVFEERTNRPILNYLLKKFGLKPFSEIEKEADIDGRIQRHNEDIEQQNKKIEEKIALDVPKFFSDNNLSRLSQIQVPYWYPDSFKEKEPYLEEIQNFFDNLKLENLNKSSVKILKEFEKFYYKNQALFEKLEQKAKDAGLNIFGSVNDVIVNRISRNEHIISYYFTFRENLKQEVRNQYENEKQKAIEDNQSFLYPKEISDMVFAKGLMAVAQFEGIIDKEQQVAFSIQKLQEIKKLEELDFEVNHQPQDILTK